jgi:hypothetical protein
MNHQIARIVIGMIAVAPLIARGDNLTGADRFLCAAQQVTYCDEYYGCESGSPSLWNMPSFIQVDLAKKTLSTPRTSAEQRRSPFTHLARDNGEIFIQGVENGRAFSLVVAEETGLASMALALDGVTLTVFGVCTPTP